MRSYRTIGLLVLCALLLVPASATGARAARTGVNLTYAFWDANQEPALRAIIAEFHREHPTITVALRVIPYAAYWNALSAMSPRAIPWDVFWMNGPSFPTFVSTHALLDLSSDVKPADLALLPPSLIQLYTAGGRHYGLVLNMDTIGLWYDKTLFDRARVPYPTCTWTWADFASAARRLTIRRSGHVAQYGAIVDSPHMQEIWGDIFPAYGGSILNAAQTRSVIASPQNITAANLLIGLLANGSALGLTSTDPDRATFFRSGKVAMLTDGSWQVAPYTTGMARGYTSNVTCIPSGPKGRFTIIHGVSDVVSAATTHRKEAAALVRFLSGPYAANVQARMASGLPAVSGSQQPWLTSHPGVGLEIFADEASDAISYPVSLGYTQWYSAVTTYFDRMVRRTVSPREALTALQSQMNAILVRYYPKA